MVIPVVMGSQLPGNLSRRQQESQNQETASSASQPDPNALQKSMGLRSGSRGVLALGVKIKTDLSTLSTAEEPVDESALISSAVDDSGEVRNGFFSSPLQTEFATDLNAFLFAQRTGDTGAVTKAAAAGSQIAAAQQDEVQSVDSEGDRASSGSGGNRTAEVRSSSAGGTSDSGSSGALASTRITIARSMSMDSTLAMIIDSFISKQNSMAA